MRKSNLVVAATPTRTRGVREETETHGFVATVKILPKEKRVHRKILALEQQQNTF